MPKAGEFNNYYLRIARLMGANVSNRVKLNFAGVRLEMFGYCRPALNTALAWNGVRKFHDAVLGEHFDKGLGARIEALAENFAQQPG